MTNKTSDEAAAMLRYIEDNDVITWHAKADRHLREVLQKYQRMESALQQANDTVKGLLDAEPITVAQMAFLNRSAISTGEALAFDPLADA